MRPLVLVALVLLATPALASPIPPSASISDPVEGQVLAGVHTVSGWATSYSSYVTTVQVRLDGGAWTTVYSCAPGGGGTYCGYYPSWTYALDTRAFPDGEHLLGARASDGTVGAGVPTSVTVTFDNDPDVVVSEPAPGSTVQGMLRVVATATAPTGAPVTAMEFVFPGRTIAAAYTGAAWVADVDTTLVRNGAGALVAKATAGGRTGFVSVPLTVDNPPTTDLRVGALASGAPQNSFGVPPSTSTRVTLAVVNEGNTGAPSSTARLEYQYKGTWRLFGVVSGAIPGYASLERTVTWTPPAGAVGEFPLRAVLDSTGQVVETDEANNVATATVAAWTDAVEGRIATSP